MVIDPSVYYDELYWTASKPYRVVLPDGTIEERQYAGPALWWDGAQAICDALLVSLGVPVGASWLDVGCGAGCFVAGFLKRNIDAYGADISGYAVAHAPTAVRGRVVCKDVTRPFAIDRAYEVCSALDLVEHIYLCDQKKLWEAFGRTGAQTLVLDIGTAHSESDVWCPEPGCEVPIDREWQSVSGHVAVLPIEFWTHYARTWGWTPDEAAMCKFEEWRASTPGYCDLIAWGRKNVLLLRR